MEQRTIKAVDTAFNYAVEKRDDGNEELIIEGYFARFGKPYYINEQMTEYLDEGCFDGVIDGEDIRALINHDTSFVLGRTTAGTLKLEVTADGLFGRVVINPDDTSATDLYARVKRGDVSQCSFGFDIGEEEKKVNPDGSVEFHITKIAHLYEVSVCTFPAYEDTYVEARNAEFENIKRERLNAWKSEAKQKLKERKSQNNGN